MTTMTLSAAIKLGAMLKPQGFSDYEDAQGGTCALGAALEAVGHNRWLGLECQIFPILERPTLCPMTGCTCGGDAGDMVVHLNDEHRWTREQIADWVATLEAAQASAVDQPAESPIGVLTGPRS